MFDVLAKECGLGMRIEEGFEVVREFTGTLKIWRAGRPGNEVAFGSGRSCWLRLLIVGQ